MLLETKNTISSLMFVFTGAETQSGLVGFSRIEKLSILRTKLSSNPCVGTGTI